MAAGASSINVPIGIVIIAIALTRLAETRHERLKLDVTGALLATLGLYRRCAGVHPGPAARLGRPVGDRRGCRGGVLRGSFLVVERNADNPLVPFSVFDNRNRVMTFVSLFLAGGVLLTLTVMIGLWCRTCSATRALHAGICFIPFAVALGLGNVVAARASPHIAPRWLIIGGGIFVLGAMLYGSTLTRTIPYFPDLSCRSCVGGFGIGVISVILPLCAVANVGRRGDRTGVGDHSDGPKPRWPDRAGGHPGGADLAHAIPGRDDRPGEHR